MRCRRSRSNAVDYLVKPVRVQRLLSALQKVPRLKPVGTDKLSHLPSTARRFLSVTERSRVVLVPVEDVVPFKADSGHVADAAKEREYLLEESLTGSRTSSARASSACTAIAWLRAAHRRGFEPRRVGNQQQRAGKCSSTACWKRCRLSPGASSWSVRHRPRMGQRGRRLTLE